MLVKIDSFSFSGMESLSLLKLHGIKQKPAKGYRNPFCHPPVLYPYIFCEKNSGKSVIGLLLLGLLQIFSFEWTKWNYYFRFGLLLIASNFM